VLLNPEEEQEKAETLSDEEDYYKEVLIFNKKSEIEDENYYNETVDFVVHGKEKDTGTAIFEME